MPAQYIKINSPESKDEINGLRPDGAGVILMYTFGQEPNADLSNVYLLLRNRAHENGKYSFQAGSGGKVEAKDETLFARMKQEAQEECYGQFNVNEQNIVRDLTGNTLCHVNDSQRYRYVSALSLDRLTTKHEFDKKLVRVTETNKLHSPFGHFFITMMEFGNYSVEALQERAQVIMDEHKSKFQNGLRPLEDVPAYALAEVKKIIDGTSELLKGLNNPPKKRGCLDFANGIMPLSRAVVDPALSDFSEASATGLVCAKDFLVHKFDIKFPDQNGDLASIPSEVTANDPEHDKWMNHSATLELLTEFNLQLKLAQDVVKSNSNAMSIV